MADSRRGALAENFSANSVVVADVLHVAGNLILGKENATLQPSSKLGEALASSQNCLVVLEGRIAEGIAVRGSADLDMLLLPQIRYLKKIYDRTGDPVVVYLAAHSIATKFSNNPCAVSSLQYSRVLSLMAQMLVAQGKDAFSLREALYHIENAIDILFRINVCSEEIIKLYTAYELHRGVIRKALGQFDESIRGMREAKKHILEKMGAIDLDLIMLTRQEIIMQQDIVGHKKLEEEAGIYSEYDQIEYYSIIKRLFEFAMNRGIKQEVDKLLPEFKKVFKRLSPRLPVISHISFRKNLGQMYLLQGEMSQASKILNMALQQSQQLNLHGQKRQITGLLIDAESGARRGLVTYCVE